jgi:hypothetical protein
MNNAASPTYLNLEYFFYQAYLFVKESYFFLVNISWLKIIFEAKTIAIIIIVLALIGIIYNLIAISRVRKFKPPEEF